MGERFISAIANRLIDEIFKAIGNEINLVWGVQKEVHDLATKLINVTNILDDADKQGFTNQTTKGWLMRLEKACYEMEDVLDEWKYAVRQQQIASEHKVCSIIPSPSSCVSFKKISSHRQIAKKVERVKKELCEILEDEAKYNFLPNQPTDNKLWRVTTSFVNEVDISGRGSQKEMLLKNILDDEGLNREQSSLKVISLVGCGGIGKTTLAQLIFKDSRVVARYPLKMWVCVSDPFDTETIVKQILEKASEGNPPDTKQQHLESLLQCLGSSIKDKKFLLVLDDVWNKDSVKWEPLKICLEKNGGMGSKIVVTTRNEDVAKIMGNRDWDVMHEIRGLSNEDCWSILSRIALPQLSESERERFKRIGMEITVKCKGLPLAAKTLGSLLLKKGANLGEWDSVAKSDVWKLEQPKIDLFPHLALSYNELPLALKRCFSYCAIFPKDYEIDVAELIQNWMAQGYLGSQGESLEREGREYVNTLAKYSLFEEFTTNEFNESVIETCKMHDIIHDFATFLRSNKSNGIIATCKNCRSSLVSQVHEYRSLFCLHEHLVGICDCLAAARALYLTDFHLPRGLEKLIQLRSLYLSDVDEISAKKLKIICKLYNLETLVLRHTDIKEIPDEIGNLIGLTHLDLSENYNIKLLPESVCNLKELRSFNIRRCESLCTLPKGFQNLKNIKHLYLNESIGRYFPDEVIGQLSGLHTLRWFEGRLSYLRNLDQLRGCLRLEIKGDMRVEEDVVKAKGSQLNKKEFLNGLCIRFSISDTDLIGLRIPEKEKMKIKNAEEVLDDLKPHPNLSHLLLHNFQGSKLSKWITLPYNNHLKSILLWNCLYLTSLPPLGKLPCLELLRVEFMSGLKFVGREFLGIKTSASVGSSSSAAGFPKLKMLRIEKCSFWEEWEDITEDEETSTRLPLLPCLQELSIKHCHNMRVLPYRLLHKAPALRHVYLCGSGVEKEDVVQHSVNGSGVSYNWEQGYVHLQD